MRHIVTSGPKFNCRFEIAMASFLQDVSFLQLKLLLGLFLANSLLRVHRSGHILLPV